MSLKKNKIMILVSLILMLSAFCVSADGGMNVLATNSWTAAFVQMAGGRAEQLAPADMQHPPEYELKPSDVKKVRDADLLVYAGYEVLMKTVFDSFGKPEEQLVRIMTSYAPDALEKSVLSIADRLGTTDEAQKAVEAYRAEITAARSKLKTVGMYGAPVLVQFHQKPLVQALGFDILGVFGPQPLEVRQIAELGKMKPRLIIDNIHSPMAAPIEEIIGIEAIELVNFPGLPLRDGATAPDTLTEVLKYNVGKLTGE